jgi:hypothetical protein
VVRVLPGYHAAKLGSDSRAVKRVRGRWDVTRSARLIRRRSLVMPNPIWYR